MTRMYKECHSPEQATYFQKKCKHLFGEEIWTRHQYQMSSTSVAHRRFIRPVCQHISMSEADNSNMMMVMPYFHWETHEGRNEMTDVIVEAMKRHISDSPLGVTTKLKGLTQALKELERAVVKARNPYYDENNDSSDYDTDISSSYYMDTYTGTSPTSDRRTRRSRGINEKPEIQADTDLIARLAPDTLDNDIIRKSQGPANKPQEERRKRRRIQKILDVAKEARSPDEKLILAYMFDDIPLHFRRTLDQYYYYTLPTTEARDTDQVISRYFEKTWPEDENLVLMVDQLWLWILDEGINSRMMKIGRLLY